ncbi:MAG: hypothetical protein C4586_08310 [Anaerolineaceae bacterium]|nr:MAG: hypothetical protein C4586_08310 [Anaerolineaceae bacterium]
MNLQDICDLFYKRMDDERGTDSKRGFQLWELVSYANRAEREIARRLELLKDSDTIGYIDLSGSAGQIDSVSVTGVTITSGAVPWATSEATTAANLAVNITAYSSTPNYRAVSRGTLVIIKAVPQTGYPTTGYSLTATASGGMAAAVTNLTGLCRHVLSIGQRHLTLHEKVIRITRFKPYSQTRSLFLFTKEDMDASFPDWETEANGTVSHGVPDYESNEIIVRPPSSAIELIEQDVIRFPLADLSTSSMDGLPEIKSEHHETMVEKMMELAYRKNDVEVRDLTRATTHETQYEKMIEDWKREHIKRSHEKTTNLTPMGLM